MILAVKLTSYSLNKQSIIMVKINYVGRLFKRNYTFIILPVLEIYNSVFR